MLHRKLGNTGIAVSKIALGTMYFGSETSEQDAFAILDTFVEAGGNLIDTADYITLSGTTKFLRMPSISTMGNIRAGQNASRRDAPSGRKNVFYLS